MNAAPVAIGVRHLCSYMPGRRTLKRKAIFGRHRELQAPGRDQCFSKAAFAG
jgi:hypothetical protein